jgi:hypothetical protein
MAHFAKLDENNVVVEVYVVNNSDVLNLPFPASEPVGIQFLNNCLGYSSKWRQTSYNNNFRKYYAGPGFTYDEQRDAFIPPKPFESWLLNQETLLWEPPVAYPDDGNMYIWDETTESWAFFSQE